MSTIGQSINSLESKITQIIADTQTQITALQALIATANANITAATASITSIATTAVNNQVAAITPQIAAGVIPAGSVTADDVAIATSGVVIEDDLLNPSSVEGMAQFTSSGAIAANSSSETNHPGIVSLSTATSAAGAAAFTSATTAVKLGGGTCRITIIFQVTSLSDGTDTYTARSGFSDSGGSGEPTDGAYVRYTHGTNAGKFQFVTRANNVETATDTGVAVAANTWYRVQIEVNAAGTSATCTINGTLAATNTTNIPTGSSRETGIVPAQITKSVGTNPKILNLDYFQALLQFTTAR